MGLSDVVNLSIVVDSSSITLPGFGVPMILANHSNFAERLRYYTNADAVLDDGFLTSDAAYRMALALFSQNPRPTRIAIGRRLSAVASVDRVVVLDDTDGAYTISIDGQDATFTASTNTADEIKAGLITAVNALAPTLGRANVTAATAGTGILTLTTDTAGSVVSVSLTGPASGHLAFSQNVLLGGNSAGTYSVIIGSRAYSVIGNGTTTASVLADQLITLINADTLVHGVTAVAGAGDSIDLSSPTQVVITTSTSGATMTVSQRTINVGIADDLAAITDEQPDWYCLLIPERTPAAILEAAEAIEAQRRMFIAQSNDAEILALPYNAAAPNADIFSLLKANGFTRTVPVYASDDTNDVAAAIAGAMIPRTPGSSTWMFKTLRGVTQDTFTATQETNLKSKNGNGYMELAGQNIFFEGHTASGEWADVIHGIDKLYADIQVRILTLFVRNPKVDYDDGGIMLIASCVSAALMQSTTDGLIANERTDPVTGDMMTPAFSVYQPFAADISSVDRERRIVPATNPITFEATLAGAIHAVTINGTVSA